MGIRKEILEEASRRVSRGLDQYTDEQLMSVAEHLAEADLSELDESQQQMADIVAACAQLTIITFIDNRGQVEK